ncbi:MAG: fumarate/nitrate reduction transcriptional regulator Fnr [Gammaproteobacteria bacterium]|nr:fumarate/nitrate reduction transcriptional regulator Fnr [Gammaproteobacteria bacterium]
MSAQIQDSKTPSQLNIDCKNCALEKMCFPAKIDAEELVEFNQLVIHHKPAKRGQYWYRAEQQFRSIFVVRSGCVKTLVITRAGNQQIRGFYLPGEMFGLDALGTGRYTTSAQVLQSSSVCEIPFSKLDEICSLLPSLQRQLLHIMSKEIHNEQCLIAMLGNTTAEERVAAFLCSMSQRFSLRGFSANEFILGMPRIDIGNYLGLAVETVCRVITRFQKKRLLTAQGKHIKILKLEQLYETASVTLPCTSAPH